MCGISCLCSTTGVTNAVVYAILSGRMHIKGSLLLIKFLSRTEESAKAGAYDRRALQQLALNVHIKHSDLT